MYYCSHFFRAESFYTVNACAWRCFVFWSDPRTPCLRCTLCRARFSTQTRKPSTGPSSRIGGGPHEATDWYRSAHRGIWTNQLNALDMPEPVLPEPYASQEPVRNAFWPRDNLPLSSTVQTWGGLHGKAQLVQQLLPSGSFGFLSRTPSPIRDYYTYVCPRRFPVYYSRLMRSLMNPKVRFPYSSVCSQGFASDK